MRTALSIWNNRIAPLFDVARHLWVVELSAGRITGQTAAQFPDDNLLDRVMQLRGLQVEQLVCGAITRSAAELLTSSGIRVNSFIAGEVDQILLAVQAGRLGDEKLKMPGCQRGRCHAAAGRTGRPGCSRGK